MSVQLTELSVTNVYSFRISPRLGWAFLPDTKECLTTGGSMSKFFKAFVLLAAIFIMGSNSQAALSGQVNQHFRLGGRLMSQKIPYYGAEFFRKISDERMAGHDLKSELRDILNGAHVKSTAQMDQIAQKCGSAAGCYMHKSIGYNAARVVLLGKMYLIQDGKSYSVKDVYCAKEYTANDFKSGQGPGPNVIPDNSVINIEHTWPQSKFSTALSKEMQKSDLHHLYPTDSKMNSLRGNYPFGEVVRETKETYCKSGASFGDPSHGAGPVFEPPTDHKGNVARSIFYFSVKYDMTIDPNQEATLKKWNSQDPVDEQELDRNEEIFKIQGSRNPFIDYPELANQIADF